MANIPGELLNRIQRALATDARLSIDGWYEYEGDQMLFIKDGVSNARYRLDLSFVESFED